MSTPKVGEIRAVSGGHGLMLVVALDPIAYAAKMMGHGPQKPDAGHWFHVSRLSERPYGSDVVQKERAEAKARGVDCNNPDCWCRAH